MSPIWSSLIAMTMIPSPIGGLEILEISDISAENAGIVLTDLDGKEVRPLDVPDSLSGHVLIFVTHDCPVANQYSPLIRKVERTYEPKGFRFFLIHVDPDLTEEDAEAHAKEFGLTGLPILFDGDHEAVEAVGATMTPEAAIVRPDGNLAYRGRIDNWYARLGRKRNIATTRDLLDALDAILDGRPVDPTRTTPVGCYIADLKRD